MRTNIVIDDRLIADAQELSGLRTKREAVEAGLKLLVQIKRQERLRCIQTAISTPLRPIWD